ncbi:MAG: hypothetical protein PHE53_14290, partial [Thermoguttaceae bacterium]|nr:hypothetical protein [Thermoguttaceae bacterium]
MCVLLEKVGTEVTDRRPTRSVVTCVKPLIRSSRTVCPRPPHEYVPPVLREPVELRDGGVKPSRGGEVWLFLALFESGDDEPCGFSDFFGVRIKRTGTVKEMAVVANSGFLSDFADTAAM